MRAAVFIVGGLETAVALAALGIIASSGQLTSPETLSRELARALLYIYGLPYLVFTLPALVMAVFNRALPVALALCVLAIAVTFVTFRNA
jgi:hypothetical protein